MERRTDNDTVPDTAPLAHCLRAFVGRAVLLFGVPFPDEREPRLPVEHTPGRELCRIERLLQAFNWLSLGYRTRRCASERRFSSCSRPWSALKCLSSSAPRVVRRIPLPCHLGFSFPFFLLHFLYRLRFLYRAFSLR